MELLPYELKVFLATFLEAPDIRILCLTTKAFARLSKDENLFRQLYTRDFLSLIRVNTEADITMVRTMLSPDYEGADHEILVNRSATEEQVQALRSDPKPRERTWHQVYATFYRTKQGLLRDIRGIFGLPKSNLTPVSDCGIKEFLIYDNNFSNDPSTSIFSSGPVKLQELVVGEAQFSPDIAAFAPDFRYSLELVKMHHLDIFHQMRLINKHQEDLHHFRDYNEEGPVNGWDFACALEGICCWSKTKQKYRLLFPICSLRRLYWQCRDQALRECKEKVESIQHVLQQVTTVQFRINPNDFDIAKRNPALLQNALTSYLDGCSLMITNVTFDETKGEALDDNQAKQAEAQAENILMTLTCSRHTVQTICLSTYCHEPVVQKGPEIDPLWRDRFCASHDFHGPYSEADFQADLRVQAIKSRRDLLQFFAEESSQIRKIRKHVCLIIKDALDGIDKEIHLKRVSLAVCK